MAAKLEIDLDLGRRLRSILLDKEGGRDLKRMSKKDRRVDDGIENQRKDSKKGVDVIGRELGAASRNPAPAGPSL